MNRLRFLFLVILVLGVAAPTAAWARFRPLEPGSVLVFHKFIRGTVTDQDGTVLPKSAFEISVVCPPGAVPKELACANNPVTSFGEAITLHGVWVCPGDPQAELRNCPDRDFTLETTINGTVWINPENVGPRTHDVAAQPPCERGFLILWVEGNKGTVNEGKPIHFNGLVGDAVLRPSESTDTAAYNAVAIQCVGGFEGAPGLPCGTSTVGGGLNFNNFDYERLTSRGFGTVRYPVFDNGGVQTTQTFLTLLTLDVFLANENNGVTNVDLSLYDADENFASSNRPIVCWDEFELTALNTTFTGKGLFRAETTNHNTLLGIIETREEIPGTRQGVDPLFRGYAYSMYYDRTTTEDTTFFPKGDPPLGGLLAPAFVPSALTPLTSPTPTLLGSPAPAPLVPSVPTLPLP